MAAPHMDITLSELQEMASRQQQQINAQQQLLATKVAARLTKRTIHVCLQLKETFNAKTHVIYSFQTCMTFYLSLNTK